MIKSNKWNEQAYKQPTIKNAISWGGGDLFTFPETEKNQ
jgi:hypothetical protein